MKYNQIIIEEKEFELLKNMIPTAQNNSDRNYNLSIRRLKKELESARIVSIYEIPDDVIRMNSTVTVQMPKNVTRNFTIVLPEKSNLEQNKLSVLSPMGLALMGYAINDTILWQFPSGETLIKILDVTQIYTAQIDTKSQLLK
jgi:regulator of nucleoside diphosphate kinase